MTGDVVADEAGFLLAIPDAADFHEVARACVRPQRLAEAAGVLAR